MIISVKENVGRKKKRSAKKKTNKKHLITETSSLLGLSFKELWKSHKLRILLFASSWLEARGHRSKFGRENGTFGNFIVWPYVMVKKYNKTGFFGFLRRLEIKRPLGLI